MDVGRFRPCTKGVNGDARKAEAAKHVAQHHHGRRDARQNQRDAEHPRNDGATEQDDAEAGRSIALSDFTKTEARRRGKAVRNRRIVDRRRLAGRGPGCGLVNRSGDGAVTSRFAAAFVRRSRPRASSCRAHGRSPAGRRRRGCRGSNRSVPRRGRAAERGDALATADIAEIEEAIVEDSDVSRAERIDGARARRTTGAHGQPSTHASTALAVCRRASA